MNYTWWYLLGCALWLVHALFLYALCYIVYHDKPQMRMFYHAPLLYARWVVSLLGALLCIVVNPRLGILWGTLLCTVAYVFRTYAHTPVGVYLYPHEWRVGALLTSVLVGLTCLLCFVDVDFSRDWSGYPTVAKGDYVVLARWPYGVYFWPTNTWLWRYADARLGDRVYVRAHTDWMGRVLARSEDTVAFTQGEVVVNDQAVSALLDGVWQWSMPGLVKRECVQGVCYQTWQHLDVQLVTRPGFSLSSGQMYVLSDNRSFAVDSRVWGGVDARSVVAKVYTISEFMGLFSL